MNQNDYIQLSLDSNNEHIDFSKLEFKLNLINEFPDDLESFFNDLNNYELNLFNTEFSKLEFYDDTVYLKSQQFNIRVKSNNIIKICDDCVLALYGYFYSYDDLKLKFCHKSVHDVCGALSAIKGSYSLVYISLHHGFVVISKDDHGSKSLLVSFEPVFTISNVASSTHSRCYEFPPFVFLVLGDGPFLYKRSTNHLHQLVKAKEVDYTNVNYDAMSLVVDRVAASISESVSQLIKLKIGGDVITILFSGCVDSSLIALIVLSNFKGRCVELINVSFDSRSSPDRITSLFTYEELINLFPDSDIRLILVDVDSEDYLGDESEIYSLSYPNHTHMDLNISASLYYAGALRGYLFSKQFFKTDYWLKFKSNLALLKSINFKVTVSKNRKPERLNSSSESVNKTLVNGSGIIMDDDYESPKGALDSEVDENDIPPLEMYEQFSMDSGYFKEYTSNSEYVLMGTGADELFGGYGRHVSAKMFNEKTSFSNEINKDILRLWKRNLGRDDRILNHRNIKSLYPFLSLNVLQCLNELPFNVSVIVDYLDPPDWFRKLNIYSHVDPSVLLNSEFISNPGSRSVSVYINKWLLREICFRLGLSHCCNFKKRAIQFGTRSAKVFNRMHNMTNRQASNKGASTFVM